MNNSVFGKTNENVKRAPSHAPSKLANIAKDNSKDMQAGVLDVTTSSVNQCCKPRLEMTRDTYDCWQQIPMRNIFDKYNASIQNTNPHITQEEQYELNNDIYCWED